MYSSCCSGTKIYARSGAMCSWEESEWTGDIKKQVLPSLLRISAFDGYHEGDSEEIRLMAESLCTPHATPPNIQQPGDNLWGERERRTMKLCFCSRTRPLKIAAFVTRGHESGDKLSPKQKFDCVTMWRPSSSPLSSIWKWCQPHYKQIFLYIFFMCRWNEVNIMWPELLFSSSGLFCFRYTLIIRSSNWYTP